MDTEPQGLLLFWVINVVDWTSMNMMILGRWGNLSCLFLFLSEALVFAYINELGAGW